MVKAKPAQFLLFDIGGVLVELDFDRTFHAWAHHSPLNHEEIRNRFHFDAAYCQHERGEIETSAYYDYLRSLLFLDGTDTQIESGWNALFVREIPEIISTIECVRKTIPCYAFTNTNAAHQATLEKLYPKMLGLFQHVFSSWQIGGRKPEFSAFHMVLKKMDAKANDVLFFDDSDENISAAQACGFQTKLVTRPKDVENALKPLTRS